MKRWFGVWIALVLPLSVYSQSLQVTGTVVDHLTNRPMNHVLVNLSSTAKDGGSTSALTESDGRFVFTNVPKGRYRLTAQRKGEMPQGFKQDSGGYGTSIIVDAGAATENLIFPLRTNASISGVALDEQGDPVHGAMVQLFTQSVVNGEVQTIPHGNSNTNTLGEFHFGHLREGTYYVAVSGRPWYAVNQQMNPKNAAANTQPNNLDMAYAVTWYGNTTNGEAASPIVLTEGGTQNIQIALHAVPAIHILLPAGQSASPRMNGGAMLSVRGPGGVRVNMMNLMMFNGTENGQQIMGFPAGRYEVSFMQRNSDDGPKQGASETVDLTDGMALRPPTAGAALVSGQISFAGGEKPDSNVRLTLTCGGLSQATVAGDDGSFTFANNRSLSGSCGLHLTSGGWFIQSVTTKAGKKLGEKVDVPASGSLVLSIVAVSGEHLAKVRGFATQNDSGYAGATVLLMPLDDTNLRFLRRDQSDSDGSFTLSGVLPGKYKLVAIDNGADLPYKAPGVMKPYLIGAVDVVVGADPIDGAKVPVQKLLKN